MKTTSFILLHVLLVALSREEGNLAFFSHETFIQIFEPNESTSSAHESKQQAKAATIEGTMAQVSCLLLAPILTQRWCETDRFLKTVGIGPATSLHW